MPRRPSLLLAAASLLAASLAFADPWIGASDRVHAVFVPAGAPAESAIARLAPHAKDARKAARKPGAYDLGLHAPDGASVTFFTLVPFARKTGTTLGSYRLGRWPQETGGSPNGYAAPAGFIRVTPADTGRYVSKNFRLGEFLTHDQKDTWPKYAVLRAELLAKLEIAFESIRQGRMSGKPDRFVIMSGFRTPEYNAPGVGAGGRVEDSRHLYGDAADVYFDADGDSMMDDLDGDGRIGITDAQWLAHVFDIVEAANPKLVGGIGVYPAAEDHGPFVHVDVRGRRARW